MTDDRLSDIELNLQCNYLDPRTNQNSDIAELITEVKRLRQVCRKYDEVCYRHHELREALQMVLGNELLERDGHDWKTCAQPSCVFARKVLEGEMKYGREFDALIAKKVMGWTNVHEHDFGNGGKQWRGDSPRAKMDILPCYSTDIVAAWEVRDKIAGMAFSVRQKFTNACKSILGKDINDNYAIHHSEIILRITPHIICLAAIKALERD